MHLAQNYGSYSYMTSNVDGEHQMAPPMHFYEGEHSMPPPMHFYVGSKEPPGSKESVPDVDEDDLKDWLNRFDAADNDEESPLWQPSGGHAKPIGVVQRIVELEGLHLMGNPDGSGIGEE